MAKFKSTQNIWVKVPVDEKQRKHGSILIPEGAVIKAEIWGEAIAVGEALKTEGKVGSLKEGDLVLFDVSHVTPKVIGEDKYYVLQYNHVLAYEPQT